MTSKNGFWIGIALGLSFMLGCGAAVTIIPPARAQSVQRWEYLLVPHGMHEGPFANEAGAEGWELVQWNGQGMTFKRPL